MDYVLRHLKTKKMFSRVLMTRIWAIMVVAVKEIFIVLARTDKKIKCSCYFICFEHLGFQDFSLQFWTASIRSIGGHGKNSKSLFKSCVLGSLVTWWTGGK